MQEVSTKELLRVYSNCADYAQTGRYFGISTQVAYRRINDFLNKAIGVGWHKMLIRTKILEVIAAMEEE